MSGNSDSLFVHLQLINRTAGRKDQLKLPVLQVQSFDIPLSRTSEYVITQSELMKDKSHAWAYWKIWSDSLTYGKWDPHTLLMNETDAYELGNFTASLIMAHDCSFKGLAKTSLIRF